MKHILAIAVKDIRETMRDRMTFMFLLVMPVIFTLMFGFAFGGNSQTATRPVVGWIDQDGSLLSTALKDFVQTSGADIKDLDSTAGTTDIDLDKMVVDGKLAAAVVVPAGYQESARRGEMMRLTVITDPASSAGTAARSIVQVAAGRAASAAFAAQSASKAAGANFTPALKEALAGWQKPPVSLAVTYSATAPAGNPMAPAQSAPGMMVQFAMAGLITAAQVLVYERKSRCMQRLLTTAVARWQILLGHYVAIFTTIFVQLVLLVIFGQAVFGLNYLGQPLATLVMALATALFMAALGLLIGTLAKTDEQAIIFSLILMFVFSALGGAWVPLENTGPTFHLVGHITPVAWALDGFRNIVAHGLGLASVWLPAAVLLGYAALCGALAVWKFKYE